MLDVPTLFERNPKTGKVLPLMTPLAASIITGWTAVEWLSGATVRVTVRSGEMVRLEVVRRPELKQISAGITRPWFREATSVGSDHWLFEAANSTDMSSAPDGEWEGEAVGEMIRNNPLGLEGHHIRFSDLFPFRQTVDPVLLPPEIGRTPVEYDDLRYWLQTTSSFLPEAAAGSPLNGVVWWYLDTPVAQIRARDFGSDRAPNPDYVGV